MKQNTSIKDIAERLHLSVATVSLTLSGRAGARRISAETQERVRQCAEEMNYRPNLLARSLNTGLSGILGLVIPDITDSFFSTIARCIELEAESQGYSLMIASSESNQDREDKMLSTLRDRQVDGIIIAPTQDSDHKIRAMLEEGGPITVIDRIFPGLQANSISVNNREATYNIVMDMLRHGARNIAFLTTNPHIYTMRERFLGYQDALAEAGIPTDERLIGNVDFQNYEDSIFDVIDSILTSVPQVDAFFFTTHVLAMETFRYFTERGIAYNSIYQLGCIHANSAFKVMAPSIRVARMPVEKIGSSAVSLTVDNIRKMQKGESYEPQSVVYDCTYPCDLNLFRKRK